jgi:hypothetical protein
VAEVTETEQNQIYEKVTPSQMKWRAERMINGIIIIIIIYGALIGPL